MPLIAMGSPALEKSKQVVDHASPEACLEHAPAAAAWHPDHQAWLCESQMAPYPGGSASWQCKTCNGIAVSAPENRPTDMSHHRLHIGGTNAAEAAREA